MNSEPKKTGAPLVLGILSVIFSVVFAIIGLILGSIGISLGLSKNGNPEFDYKIANILNGVGIGVAVINMIISFMMTKG